MKQLTKIGYIAKPHKFNGVVKLFLKNYSYANTVVPAFLFIEINNIKLPYFIENLEALNSNELIVKFEELDNKESAANLKGASVFIDDNDKTHQCFEKTKTVEDELDLAGYDLFDEENNFIAKIEAVYFVPNNTLIAVLIDEKEVLLPLNEQLIVDINHSQKTVHLIIPDGLLSLNNDSTEEE